MSRILRRPMFRGGGTVDSYGKGITAPLVPGYMGGGQIGGGIIYGKPMADGRFGFQSPVMFNAAEMTMPASGSITSGLELLAKNKALRDGNVPMIPVNVAKNNTSVAGVVDDKEESKPINITSFEDDQIGVFPEDEDLLTTTKTNEAGNQVYDFSPEMSLEAKAAANLISASEYAVLKEKEKTDNLQKRLDAEGADAVPGKGGGADIMEESVAIEDPKLPGEKELEEGTQISAKDAIAENQKLFAELLGADKARGQDIGDMLLRFSGSQGNTLGEKFQNYTRAESAAGPSRSEKIKQTAAGLAINDYVAGKRSKEQIEALKTKIDYTQGVKDASVQLSASDDLSLAKAKASKLTDKGINSDETTKALIQTKLGTGVPVFRAQIKLKDIVKKADKLKPGYNLVDNEGVTTIVFYDGTNQPQVKGTIDEFWSS
jgi:hypothetical protein